MSTPARTPTARSARTAQRVAARVSRLRALALAERERYRNGWCFDGDGATQRCPCCARTVRAIAPEPPGDPAQLQRYERQVSDVLNTAVLDHLHHDCDAAEEDRP